MNTAFHIPEPCHESWQAMHPQQNGRLCDACCKMVVDFTGMSNHEILNYLNQRKGERVCGRVKNEQLSDSANKKTIAVLPQKKFRLQRFAAALWLVFGTFLFSACNNDMKVGEIEPADSTLQHKSDTVHADKTYGSIKQKAQTVTATVPEEIPLPDQVIPYEEPIHRHTVGIMITIPELEEISPADTTSR
jgi:hypothetical protein